MGDDTIQCPKCGHENPASAVECDNCGVTFSLVFGGTKKDKGKIHKPPSKEKKNPAAKHISQCPKCGHAVIAPAEECIKCGIIFQKYFEVQERKLKEAQEKAESEIRETEEKQPAEAEIREPEKKDKAEKKGIEEKRPAEAEIREPEEKDQTETEKREKEKAEAIQKEKEEKAEARRKEAADQKMIQVLSAETDLLRAEAEKLRKEKDALEKAAALRREQDEKEKAEALKEEKRAQAKAEAIRKEREDQTKRMETILKTLVPTPNYAALLKKYEGQEIGVNFDDPAEIRSARLARVNEDHFSILNMENEFLYSYSFSNIVSIVEAMDGVPVETIGQHLTYPVVVRVFHLMVKKKWSFI